MVNDMLFLARADRGDRVTERSSADLRVEAGKVLDYFEAALEEAGITAAIEGEGVVAGDPSLLRRALTNLLGNAIRYTSRGQRIAIRLVRSADAVQLSVRNPGDTVDPVHLPRIFDRFFRVDAARRAVGENHGLGLAIVRAIARMHGGDVFATSAKGITEIGLRVPAQAGESPRIASQVGAQRARTTET
jgi:two-component system heavy metal sensor histidine kinase CusS